MTKAATWMFILSMLAIVPAACADGEPKNRFTPSPEHRAKLLAKVRAQDQARARKKKRTRVLTIVKNGQARATIVCSAGQPARRGRGAAG